MSEYEIALYKDPTAAAQAILNLEERMLELEAKVERLQRWNKLKDAPE